MHGEAGVGKSWFAGSGPIPRLILDAEGRGKYLPGTIVQWDPTRYAPPVADGTWDTCVVTVDSFDVPNTAFQWLAAGQHPFVSSSLDSIMEIQKRCVDQIAGQSLMSTPDWGVLLRKLEKLLRDFRDLVLVETNPLCVVTFVVGTAERDGARRPLLQGQLRSTIPYIVDLVGYMFTAPPTATVPVTDDAVAVSSVPTAYAEDRWLLTRPQPGFIAKEGMGGRVAGPLIRDPNLTQIFEALRT